MYRKGWDGEKVSKGKERDQIHYLYKLKIYVCIFLSLTIGEWLFNVWFGNPMIHRACLDMLLVEWNVGMDHKEGENSSRQQQFTNVRLTSWKLAFLMSKWWRGEMEERREGMEGTGGKYAQFFITMINFKNKPFQILGNIAFKSR